MPTDFPDLLTSAVILLTTYWLHSGLALVLVWLVLRTGRIKSLVLTEWLWKSAAVIAVITVPPQWAGGFSDFVFDISTGPMKPLAVVAAKTDRVIETSTLHPVVSPSFDWTEPSFDAVADDTEDLTNQASIDLPVDPTVESSPATEAEISVVDSEEIVDTNSFSSQLLHFLKTDSG